MKKLHFIIIILSIIGFIIYIPIGSGILSGLGLFILFNLYKKIYNTRKEYGGNIRDRFGIRVYSISDYNIYKLGIEYTNDYGFTWNYIYGYGKESYYDTYYDMYPISRNCYTEDNILSILNHFNSIDKIKEYEKVEKEEMERLNKEKYESIERVDKNQKEFIKNLNR